MSGRHRLGVLAAFVVLSLFGAGARAQTTTPAPKPTEATVQTSPAAPKEPATETAEPEWRIGFLTIGADVAETSAYVWRGWVLHDGTCFQPDLWVTIADVTVTSWLNVRHDGRGDNRFNEHDLTIDYSRAVGRLTLSAGWNNYRFFGLDSGHSNEFYLGAQADVLLQPGVRVYHDVEQGNGSYVSLSAGHQWPMGMHVTGSTQVTVGYSRHLYMTGSGFSDVGITLKLSIPMRAARAALQPTLTYSHSLMPDQFPSKLLGGLAVAFK